MKSKRKKHAFIYSFTGHSLTYDVIKNDFDGIVEGKWVEEENLHLTWVFLGDVADPQPVIEKLQDVPPLESEITILSLGFFGHPPRILFAKAEEEVQLCSKAKYSKRQTSISTNSNRISPYAV